MSPTYTPDSQSIFPTNDEHFEQLKRYVAGLMSDAEAERFEDRLVEDEAFFNSVSPFLHFWTSRKPLDAERDVLARHTSGDTSSAEAAQKKLKIAPTPPEEEEEEPVEKQRAPWSRHVHRLVPWTALAAAIVVGLVALLGPPPAPEQPRTVATNDSTHQGSANRSAPGVVGPPGTGVGVTGGPPGTTPVDTSTPRKGRGSFMDGFRDGMKASRSAKANGGPNVFQRALDWFRAQFSKAPTVPSKPTP
jgi:hypothetical protein